MSKDYEYTIADTQEVAAVKTGIAGWKAYKWTAAGRDNIIEGCVPGGIFTRGPRKGTPNFRHKDTKYKCVIVVTELELEQAAIAYEAQTGKCWNCKGEGQVYTGWSAKEGVRYGPCRRCGQSGNQIKPTVQETITAKEQA